MNIKVTRQIIRSAQWLRNDLEGGTREEFKRQNVGPQLAAKIAELEALVIPARFADDIANRDQQIEYARKVIARWESKQ